MFCVKLQNTKDLKFKLLFLFFKWKGKEGEGREKKGTSKEEKKGKGKENSFFFFFPFKVFLVCKWRNKGIKNSLYKHSFLPFPSNLGRKKKKRQLKGYLYA